MATISSATALPRPTGREIRDARSLSQLEQEQLRRLAVRLISEGHPKQVVADVIGVAPATVARWVARHELGGSEALAARRRGRRPGHTKLPGPHQRETLELICSNTPEQLRLPGHLWTRTLIATLIESRFGIEVREAAVGRYLQSWGLTLPPPLRQAHWHPEAPVRDWLRTRYPQIVKRAHRDRAEILFVDESGPTLAAVSNHGSARFTVIREPVSAGTLDDFIRRLTADADGRRLCLVLSGSLPARDPPPSAWAAAHMDLVAVHRLPI